MRQALFAAVLVAASFAGGRPSTAPASAGRKAWS
jgi:hypothetical protein